jgi:hypothetical protein
MASTDLPTKVARGIDAGPNAVPESTHIALQVQLVELLLKE